MKECFVCKTELEDNAEFCTNCGARQPEVGEIEATGTEVTTLENTVEEANPQPVNEPVAEETQAQPQIEKEQSPNLVQPILEQPQTNTAPQSAPMYSASAAYEPVEKSTEVETTPVTLLEWVINYLILMVPILNIVMLCIWSFGKNCKPSQKTWARASLIWMAIITVILIIILIMIGFALANLFAWLGNLGNGYLIRQFLFS